MKTIFVLSRNVLHKLNSSSSLVDTADLFCSYWLRDVEVTVIEGEAEASDSATQDVCYR